MLVIISCENTSSQGEDLLESDLLLDYSKYWRKYLGNLTVVDALWPDSDEVLGSLPLHFPNPS